jgi:hypothetical protein
VAKRKKAKRKAGRQPKLRTPASRQKFLALLRRKGGYVEATCRAFGIVPGTLYNEQNSDPEFKAQVKAVAAECFEDLEATAYERAMKGSDSLMRFLLAVGNPRKYAIRHQMEHAGEIIVNHDVQIAIVEDPAWYGRPIPRLDDHSAAGSPASDSNPALPGPVQGSGVRPPVGQNGSGLNGHHPGPRPEAGDVPGSG